MKYLLSLFLVISNILFAQQKGDNLIIVKGVYFTKICNSLLDSGYSIEKKDAELGTVKTEFREYENKFNGAYFMEIRVKDSVAYIKAKFSAPWSKTILAPNIDTKDPFWKEQRVVYSCNNKGKPTITLESYPFSYVNSFAKSLGGSIEYKKE